MDLKIDKSILPKNVVIPPEKQKELKKLKNACNEFESLFTYQLMKEMNKTVHKTGLVNGGKAEDIFSDMLDQERSKKLNLGLGDLLFKQLSQTILPQKRNR
ncbi:MAG: rod-binding protein [Candidatus Riflebacteria bacterium]|nr:rod-binding protein [Candidatus Riflebacteria bacterium]